MVDLDVTGARIVGVLIEKQFTVPDAYPLSENALVAGCNQKSNRDPAMSLEPFQVAGALMQLHADEVVARVEGGGRVAKYRHKLDELLSVGNNELAVLAELLLRGPQAPGALKPRVARMGFHGTAAQIEHALRELAARTPPLVTQLPQRPRERDCRWQHLLGTEADRAAAASPQPAPAAAASSAPATADADLVHRVAELERRLDELERRLGD